MVKRNPKLVQWMEQYEKLADEKKDLSDDQKEIRKKMKEEGRSVRSFKLVYQLRKLDAEELAMVISEANNMMAELSMQHSFNFGDADDEVANDDGQGEGMTMQ